MRISKLLFAGLICLLWAGSASAVNGFSRACTIGSLKSVTPEPMRIALLLLLKAVSSMTPSEYQKILEAKGAGFTALESITADYGNDRYYLYAKSEAWYTTAYSWRVPNPPRQTWTFHSLRQSPGWRNDRIDPAIVEHPLVSTYLANRRFLRSARAGHPSIFENTIFLKDTADETGFFLVMGEHYYVRAGTDVKMKAPNSRAEDCNLSAWGFFEK